MPLRIEEDRVWKISNCLHAPTVLRAPICAAERVEVAHVVWLQRHGAEKNRESDNNEARCFILARLLILLHFRPITPSTFNCDEAKNKKEEKGGSFKHLLPFDPLHWPIICCVNPAVTAAAHGASRRRRHPAQICPRASSRMAVDFIRLS